MFMVTLSRDICNTTRPRISKKNYYTQRCPICSVLYPSVQVWYRHAAAIDLRQLTHPHLVQTQLTPPTNICNESQRTNHTTIRFMLVCCSQMRANLLYPIMTFTFCWILQWYCSIGCNVVQKDWFCGGTLSVY